MLIFNCTKEAGKFIKVTKQGKKARCISVTADENAEDVINSLSYDASIYSKQNAPFQWQWLIHVITVKRKKYFLVMDYASYYCILMPANKIKNHTEFLIRFDAYLIDNFFYFSDDAKISPEKATTYTTTYNIKRKASVFNLQSNSNLQHYINNISAYLEKYCKQNKIMQTMRDYTFFNTQASQSLKNKLTNKQHFDSNKSFFDYWLTTFAPKDLNYNESIDVALNNNTFESS